MIEHNIEKGTTKRELLATILLIITTILWGSSFIITKTVTKEIPVLFYLGLRYFIALIGMVPFLIYYTNFNRKLMQYGTISGLFFFIAMVFQTYGLQYTTAGKAGFITGLSTLIVPFMIWILFKRHFKKKIWLAVFLSIIGMAFLFLENTSYFLIGDFLVFICAISYALFIVLNDTFLKFVDLYLYSFVQLSTLVILLFIGSCIMQESIHMISFDLELLFLLIYMGIFVSTLTVIFQNWAQKQNRNPTQTAIIFNLEPVFAVVFAFIIAGEILTWFQLIGCCIIFISVLIAVYEKSGRDN